MVNKKVIDFGESDDEELKSENVLKINKNYADRYEKWRNKEELQRLKDKYGDVEDEESSTDESEDDDAKELTEDVEKEFLKALSLVKSRDPKIYDKEHCKFFDRLNKKAEEEESENDESQNKKSKKDDKVTLRDLEREMILKKLKKSGDDLENTNIFEDDEYHNEDLKIKSDKGYYEEQDEIKEKIKTAIKKIDTSDEEDNDFLKVKSKTSADKEKEEADYIEWLKGKKDKVKDPELEKNMKYLHDYWNDPKLTHEEKYLRDFILNKRYISKSSDEDDDEEEDEVKQTIKSCEKDPRLDQPLDYVDLSEEEKIVENQETFERKYNFRYEEPDPEFIKSYPRTVADSMRRKETKRKEKRQEYKERKEAEKQKKKEEIKRLKSLKRKEIMDKLEKLKKITGNFDLKLDVDDLEKDFDPDEYEKKMQATFNDDFYQQPEPDVNDDPDNEDDKPVFTDDEEEDMKYINWDEWGNQEEPTDEPIEEEDSKKKKKKKKKDDDLQDPDFIMDADYDPSMEQPKSKKKGKFAEAVLKKKPVFDPNEKSFEEYFEEYYKLDCEDVIGGDLPCRFKYREVVPNDYGLTVEEILASKDTELNQWASLKKSIQYRPIHEEIAETKVYKNKKNQVDLKKKILASYYNPPEEEDDEEDDEKKDEKEDSKQSDTETASPKKHKKQKKDKKKDDDDEVEKVEKNKKNKHKDKVEESKVEKTEKQSKSEKSEKKVEKVKDKNGVQKPKKKKKNKNIMESLTDERLAAYGINPKKFKKKLKYSNKNTEKI